MMEQREKRIRRRLRADFPYYAEKCLKIRTKTGAIRPLLLNTAQRHIHARIEEQREKTGRVRVIILKGRQQGCSTYVEGRFYWRTTHGYGKRAFILTHEQDATDNLFEIAGRYHEHCPDLVKPATGAANAKELHFAKLDSGYRVATAGNKAAGRSATIQFFHGSEVAYWPNADMHASGVMQAVPDAEGTEIILESTANGQGNYFHQLWQRASASDGDFIAIFVPWFWQEEYKRQCGPDFTVAPDEAELVATFGLTSGQLTWRRAKIRELGGGKIGEELFRREYPCTAEEAFMASVEDVVIPPMLCAAAKTRDVQQIKGYRTVWGVDVARFGDDRSALAKRRANVLLEPVKWWHGLDTMQLCGKIQEAYEAAGDLDDLNAIDPNYEPCLPGEILVDVVGMGAGVVDRLRELGLPARGVNVAESASAKDEYDRLRDELWFRGREWLDNGDARFMVPEGCADTHEPLIAELSTPKYTITSSGKKKVESKDDLKKRGMRSPDLADAFLTTFAGGIQKIERHISARYSTRRKRNRPQSYMAV